MLCKDERARAKRLGKAKFDLNQEHDKLSQQLKAPRTKPADSQIHGHPLKGEPKDESDSDGAGDTPGVVDVKDLEEVKEEPESEEEGKTPGVVDCLDD